MRLFLLILIQVGIGFAVKFEAMVSSSALNVIHSARTKNIHIRQCNCNEMNSCFEEAKQQALECLEPCFREVRRFDLVRDPESLRQCFLTKKEFVNNLLLCFQNNIRACVEPGKESKSVPSADLTVLIDRVEEVVTQQAEVFLRTVNSPEIAKVADAAKAIGQCLKTCFIKEKNPHGFCFDRIKCMPYITDRNARRAVRQCSRAISWKKEIGEMCTCSAHAGLGTLTNYCGIFNLMGR
ncbi:unnamed protein product, partial [Mesorhabditis belari]|uniref:Uncharacterized protein n=1 Tax=Mesorhabditis belari TaxID=2138241 RepID=A0AAF3J9Y8_9BILA